MYTKKVLDYFKKPKNLGKIKNADGVGKVGNMTCGDVIPHIKVKEEKGKEIISDIKFQTFGCVAAIATSSAVTEMVKGKTFEEALEVGRRHNRLFRRITSIKVHCSVLATEALAEAIYDYLSKIINPYQNFLKNNMKKQLKKTKCLKRGMKNGQKTSKIKTKK